MSLPLLRAAQDPKMLHEILVIDVNPLVRRLVRDILVEAGYDVVEALEGRQVLRSPKADPKTESPQIVLFAAGTEAT
ncbi:MAG TPA: hypothetical protein VMG58_10255 [Candidatus Sulfotelmatobacter sp.]|nr:hypothetical protein [Candidatus Sulfotelmatobacter sp.]